MLEKKFPGLICQKMRAFGQEDGVTERREEEGVRSHTQVCCRGLERGCLLRHAGLGLRVLLTIAHFQNLAAVIGDFSVAFTHTPLDEKERSCVGPPRKRVLCGSCAKQGASQRRLGLSKSRRLQHLCITQKTNVEMLIRVVDPLCVGEAKLVDNLFTALGQWLTIKTTEVTGRSHWGADRGRTITSPGVDIKCTNQEEFDAAGDSTTRSWRFRLDQTQRASTLWKAGRIQIGQDARRHGRALLVVRTLTKEMGLSSPETEYYGICSVGAELMYVGELWRHWDTQYSGKCLQTHHRQEQSRYAKACQVCDLCRQSTLWIKQKVSKGILHVALQSLARNT